MSDKQLRDMEFVQLITYKGERASREELAAMTERMIEAAYRLSEVAQETVPPVVDDLTKFGESLMQQVAAWIGSLPPELVALIEASGAEPDPGEFIDQRPLPSGDELYRRLIPDRTD